MRILIVNTSERTGGAAVAARRLMEALNNSGVKAKMLVRDKETEHISVCQLPHAWRQRWHFLWERWCLFCHLHFRKRHLFEIDMANAGTDITRLPEFAEADIVHLAWVNQGMLSLHNIRKIMDSGKPVVWTMHDMWPATAICHLTLGCQRFRTQCGDCPYLPGHAEHDLAARIWQRKARLLRGRQIHFVACSQWLASEARSSRLLEGQPVVSIPNPIDTRVFRPGDKAAARQLLGLPQNRRLILFASQRATNVNKGMGYLAEACRLLVEQHPEMRADTALVVLGGHAEEVTAHLALPAYPLGYLTDTARIVAAYQAADLFVLPSLSENLPNTIMEAMACGVPCIGFRVGGIAEEIDHQVNGYVAAYKDAADLARGIHWVLAETDHALLAAEAVKKVARCYAQRTVAMRYIDIYNKVLAKGCLEV